MQVISKQLWKLIWEAWNDQEHCARGYTLTSGVQIGLPLGTRKSHTSSAGGSQTSSVVVMETYILLAEIYYVPKCIDFLIYITPTR